MNCTVGLWLDLVATVCEIGVIIGLDVDHLQLQAAWLFTPPLLTSLNLLNPKILLLWSTRIKIWLSLAVGGGPKEIPPEYK